MDGGERERVNGELMHFERAEHMQKMKVMQLEQEVLELKRIKLQKQIAVLSNMQAFNLAMQ